MPAQWSTFIKQAPYGGWNYGVKWGPVPPWWKFWAEPQREVCYFEWSQVAALKGLEDLIKTMTELSGYET